jgi:bifunctional DNase/RNase
MGRRSRVKWCLLGCLIGAGALIGTAALSPGRVTSALRLVATSDLATRARAVTERESVGEDTLISLSLETVGVDKITNQPVVILKETSGERYLFISVGFAEASAISVVTEGITLPRPLTADLICAMADKLGASIDSIIISDIQDNTFYARIVLTADWMKLEIDSRPSDAMAIALRVGAPIYAEEHVLDEAGIQPEPESGDYVLELQPAL